LSSRGNSKDEYTYGWYSANTENNDMQDIITRIKVVVRLKAENTPTLDSQVISTYLLS
jgi:hypothetical protein